MRKTKESHVEIWGKTENQNRAWVEKTRGKKLQLSPTRPPAARSVFPQTLFFAWYVINEIWCVICVDCWFYMYIWCILCDMQMRLQNINHDIRTQRDRIEEMVFVVRTIEAHWEDIDTMRRADREIEKLSGWGRGGEGWREELMQIRLSISKCTWTDFVCFPNGCSLLTRLTSSSLLTLILFLHERRKKEEKKRSWKMNFMSSRVVRCVGWLFHVERGVDCTVWECVQQILRDCGGTKICNLFVDEKNKIKARR